LAEFCAKGSCGLNTDIKTEMAESFMGFILLINPFLRRHRLRQALCQVHWIAVEDEIEIVFVLKLVLNFV
jgi:hypothetical protein